MGCFSKYEKIEVQKIPWMLFMPLLKYQGCISRILAKRDQSHDSLCHKFSLGRQVSRTGLAANTTFAFLVLRNTDKMLWAFIGFTLILVKRLPQGHENEELLVGERGLRHAKHRGSRRSAGTSFLHGTRHPVLK